MSSAETETETKAETEPRRNLAAAIAGGAAGILVFALLVALGLLLYQRLYGDSTLALVILLAVFGGLGAYAGWLLGVLVFSAIRGSAES